VSRRQSGISTLLVIFLLGAVSVMGVAVSMLSTSQHFSAAFSARGAQAWLAARAGLEYAIARITAGAGCAGVDPALTLEGYAVALTCTVTGTFDEGQATSYSVYQLTATASGGSFSAPDVANRRQAATVKFP